MQDPKWGEKALVDFQVVIDEQRANNPRRFVYLVRELVCGEGDCGDLGGDVQTVEVPEIGNRIGQALAVTEGLLTMT